MSAIRIAVTVVFFIVCAVLIYLIFLGKGEGADLNGTVVARNNDTYFSTHGRKHTEDAMRERLTFVFIALFIVLSLVLNMGWGL